MNRKDLLNLCKEKYGTVADYPFKDDQTAVLRHKSNKKWYGIIINVSPKVFGLEDGSKIDIINVKIDPIMMGSFLNERGVYPAYHMNKNNWVSIILDGIASKETVEFLIDVSYSLTKNKPK